MLANGAAIGWGSGGQRGEVVQAKRWRNGRVLTLALSLLLAVVLTGCPEDENPGNSPTSPTSPTSGPFDFLAGNWSGTWTDTRYNVSGTLQASFVVSGSTVTANGTIGLGSLGLGDETGTGSGTIAGDSLSFSFSSATVGNGSGTIASGNGSGTGTVTGALNFGAFTYQGTANSTTIDGTFNFTSATGGNGVATLTKQ